MYLWQLTVIAFLAVIATLIGALLVYARVFTGRIDSVNATLKRIEEALLRADIPEERVPAAAAEATQSPELPVHAIDGGISYLTVRDLKVISRAGRRSGESDVALNPLSPGTQEMGGELQNSPESAVVKEDLAATRSETHEAPASSGELQGSSGNCDVDADLIERRKRDALVILSNQRRRRRARGY